MLNSLQSSFGTIFEPDLFAEIAEVGNLTKVSEGEKIIEIGQYVRGMPLLLSGAIKILREDDEGDELLLYYLERGDTCSMTMACCLGDTQSEIRAIAETDVELVMLPVRKMEEWTAKYRSWRNFVFDSYHNRLNELLTTVDSIAFKNMDQRLVEYLEEKSRISSSKIIVNTHQEIADDLHSSRVVISRLLKKLEHLGKIKIHRNQIKLINF
ncbi:Crp/Fnr family transcriptional regulator [Croceitalea rosinachiae]|uniref:Crp/Fnr family transcriptional regulator n=1 Tax=Croceitalea rosinachiae TaxID=3075596 RepID=A0ABU3A7L4_9FLAO|nr:Crp/Fnr family transcriptional regulator [Croceitalea sp. F388]MDT0605939.1 Crp/Fnr family transcriptional regulator [Croceitalea sp. F388]